MFVQRLRQGAITKLSTANMHHAMNFITVSGRIQASSETGTEPYTKMLDPLNALRRHYGTGRYTSSEIIATGDTTLLASHAKLSGKLA